MRIETARLIIRTFEPRDADNWIALANDPAVTRYLPPAPPATLETFQGALERRHAMEREHGYAMWVVELKATGEFIGQCGFYLSEDTGPDVELAYHYGPAGWGKGYGTEAAAAVLAQALGPIGLDHVIALVMPENVGSWRVMEKVGMRFVDVGTYYDLPNLKRYIAERSWWRAPLPE